MKPQLPELDVTDAKALLAEICLVVDSIVRIAGVGFPMWYRYRSSVQPFTGMPNDRASRQARSASRLATACGERSLCATRCLELCHDILQTFFTNIPRPIILDANVVTLRAEQIRPRGSIGRRPSALWQRVGGEALIASWDAARSAHKCRSRCVGYSERMEIVKLAVSRILATMQHPLSMTVRAAMFMWKSHQITKTTATTTTSLIPMTRLLTVIDAIRLPACSPALSWTRQLWQSLGTALRDEPHTSHRHPP
jgi:hypothetical protein